MQLTQKKSYYVVFYPLLWHFRFHNISGWQVLRFKYHWFVAGIVDIFLYPKYFLGFLVVTAAGCRKGRPASYRPNLRGKPP